MRINAKEKKRIKLKIAATNRAQPTDVLHYQAGSILHQLPHQCLQHTDGPRFCFQILLQYRCMSWLTHLKSSNSCKCSLDSLTSQRGNRQMKATVTESTSTESHRHTGPENPHAYTHIGNRADAQTSCQCISLEVRKYKREHMYVLRAEADPQLIPASQNPKPWHLLEGDNNQSKTTSRVKPF